MNNCYSLKFSGSTNILNNFLFIEIYKELQFLTKYLVKYVTFIHPNYYNLT